MKKFILSLVFIVAVSVVGFAQNGAKKANGNKVNPPAKQQPAKTDPPATEEKKQDEPKPTTKTPKRKTPPKDGYAVEKDLRDTVSQKAFLAVIKDEDVVYTKRVWRDIDLRDTVNSVLNFPKSRLIEILLNAVKLEELTAYNPKDPKTLEDDDAFNFPLDTADAMKLANGVVNVTNNKAGTVKEVPGEFNPALFLKYRVKEDWVFDGKRGVFEPRIIGLAPLKLNAQTKDWQPIFWIYYDDARDLLSKKRLFNALNDSSPVSMDDFFVHRLFSSYIVKETNSGDYKLKDIISDPKERLLESEKIKKKMADFEQGLWQY